jgi:sugar phosphate isomerase/epimerase
MKLGFNTMCLYDSSFSQIADFAQKSGFSTLEIVCTQKDLPGIHHLMVEDVLKDPGETIEILKKKNLEISCLAHYANPLFGEAENGEFNRYIKLVIDAARALGVKNVSTFTGHNPGLSWEETLKTFDITFKPLVKYAGEYGINLLLENTPIIIGYSFAGNFAYSPETWETIFTRIPDINFGLNYDPSHLFWQGIDYAIALKMFGERIHHIQAKDSEILVEHLRITGIYGNGWFRYCLPGVGSIDWKKLILSAYEAGYDGVICIENEDLNWTKSQERAKKGLLLAKKSLDGLIV